MTRKPRRRRTALDALAEFYGIEGQYESATGETMIVAEETRRALLLAMGVDAGTEAEATRLLKEAEDQEWRQPLPPITVDRGNGRNVGVEVTLPRGTGRVAWMICFEEGGEVTGEAEFPALALSGVRKIGRLTYERRRLVLPEIPLGYHGIALNEPGVQATLVAAPEACWLPEVMTGGARTFGIALQLYLLRSARNWGIGDFGDLTRFVELAAGHGADVIGLNPLHALFADEPDFASPYSPASRLLLNPLYIAVENAPGAEILSDWLQRPDVVRRIEAARAAPEVDYTAVARLKDKALRQLHREFWDCADDERRRPFEAFLAERGDSFHHACLFLALREHFAAADPPRPDWREWPEAYRDPEGQGALEFRTNRAEAVDYQAWLQFIADEQLGAAAEAAREAGMAVGLYRDLAVGADPGGGETWAGGEAVIRAASVGAPPDIFMPSGQNWGLPPFHPRALKREGYRSFIELVRANMRHAGGLRIDHVMGLLRLWCMPEGASPREGAYLHYPLDDLVGILALESRRSRCLVVGEDLGTVPEGFRERMAEANVLSYRVLFFEQDFDHGTFHAARDYPEKALAVSGSHDLPTLRGWWTGADNDVKERLGLFASPEVSAAQRERRDRDRENLVALLRADGLLPAEGTVDEAAFAAAASAFLAETSAGLAIAQLDDITCEVDQVNVPGTHDEHPNWRRRYAMTLEELADSDEAWRCVLALAARKRGAGRQAGHQPLDLHH